ncbi:MAG: CHRD domain-containing protein [Anaerolineales bacterium]
MYIKSQLTTIRKILLSLVVLMALLALLVAVIPAAAEGRPLSATLTGAAVVPDPPGGDPDGTGAAQLTLNQGQGEVCFSIIVSNVESPGPAHIHIGAAGEAGGVVVALTSSVSNAPEGCVDGVDAELIKAIRQNPANYYVQVHNAEFPAGVVRGQLSK